MDALKNVIQESPAGTIVTELAGGRIVSANESFLRLTGFAKDEVIGRLAVGMGSWPEPEQYAELLANIAAGESIRDIDVQIMTKSGQPRHVRVSSEAMEIDGVAYVVSRIKDTADVSDAATALRAAESRYRSLVEQIPVVTYTERPGDTDAFTYVSPQIEALLGYAPVEILSQPGFYASRIHPEDRQRVEQEDARSTRSGEPFAMEYRVQAQDGSWRHIRDQAVLVRDEAGQPLHWQGALLDLTEQRRAEEALLETLEQAYTLMRVALDAIITADEAGHVTELNPAAAEMLGHDRDEALGRNLTDFIAPPERRGASGAKASQDVASILGIPLGERVQTMAMRADGSHFPIELTLTRLDGSSGPMYVGYLRDISARIAFEAALRASEERFRALVQNSYDVITVVNRDGTREYISPSIEHLLGFSQGDLIGGEAISLVHPDDAPALRAAIALCVGGAKQTPALELRFRHRDGGWRHFETIATNLLDEPGVNGIVFNSREITERKLAEEALQQSERRFRAAFDHAPIGHALVTSGGTFQQVNRALCQLVGFTEDELKEMTLRDISYPEDLEDHIAMFARLWDAEIDSFDMEERYVRKDGRIIWVDLTASAFADGAGQRCAIVQMQDITDRRRLDLDRATMLASERAYARELRDLTAMRADLSRMVSHELRAPVAALRMMTSALATHELSPEAEAEMAAAIQSQLDQLDRLTADVAAVSTAEQDSLSVQLHAVPLSLLLSGAAAYAQSAMSDYPTTIDAAGDVQVWCDPERIGQVLHNLLDNVVKHTPPGTPVEIRASVSGDMARIEVADEGPGIAGDDLSIIFEKFARGQGVADRESPGLGIGLYVSQQIVQAHGSELTVRPGAGGGTVFSFDLRIAR